MTHEDKSDTLFASIVRENHERIYRVCYGLLRDPVMADEAAQDVFLKAYKSLSAFKGGAQISTWLHRLAVNHCMDVLRARSRSKTDSLERALLTPEQEPSAEADRISEVIALLKPEFRQILWLREVEEKSYEDIALELGVTVDSVKSTLKRARNKLREKWLTRFGSVQRLTIES